MGVADGPPAQPSSDTDSPLKERRFGDYVLGRQLGSGGMGVVYEAHQASLNRNVALKFIRDSQMASPTLLRRFAIEAEATARLHHPGIVGIHEIGEVDGHPYFSMDLIEGDSLRTAMIRGRFVLKLEEGSKTNGRIRQIEIARLMAKTARAVHHAHQRGVLHRDLKPANILVDCHGEPHLTDFGLAKILRQTTDERLEFKLTPRTEIAGTASYMSPEQALSDEITTAADVYGLGAVLYELLTGEPPFKAATLFETLKQLQEEPPRRPRLTNPFVNRDLETICLKCLEKNPGHRYASAEDLAKDLESWIEHKPIKAAPPTLTICTLRWMKRNPAGTALIGALFLGLFGALILLTVVDYQKKKFELQQSLLFREKVDQMAKDWHNLKDGFLVIPSKDLAILDNRVPSDNPAAHPLSLGGIVRRDPVSYAQQVAAFLLDLEATLSKALRQSVQLILKAIPNDAAQAGPLLQGQVDFMLMEATDYLRLQVANPGITAFARIDHEVLGAVVASTHSGITNLQQLRGKTIAFPSSSSPLTIGAKARLANAGVVGKDLQAVTNYDATSLQSRWSTSFPITPETRGRELVGCVLKGEIDAAVTYLRRYEYEKHEGLVLLDSFTITPKLFVARAGLETNVIAAFKSSLPGKKSRTPPEHPVSAAFDWEESFPGAIGINDNYLDGLREAMCKAARFEGEPDPFPPNANTPLPGKSK